MPSTSCSAIFVPPATEIQNFSFGQAMQWLFARNQFSIKLGLDSIQTLLAYLGNPEKELALLHVAGTNGKGSVCGNLAALLRGEGVARVGLYTSPHLVSYRERIRIDDVPIARAAVLAFIREHGPFCEEMGATYFEIATAMALVYFRDQGCEAVVLETGLGGRLDATNAVLPRVTVITPVDIDHTAYLGATVDLIFAEKAAILKPATPMVVAEQAPGLVAKLSAAAAAVASPMIRASDYPWSLQGDTWVLPTPRSEIRLPAALRRETHQRSNLALACLAAEAFLNRPLALNSPDLLRHALPAGRTQVLQAPGRLPLILDGAHNPHGLRALAQTLQDLFPDQRRRALFAMMADKPVDEALAILQNCCQEIVALPLWESYPRAWHPPVTRFASTVPLTREGLLAALNPVSGVDVVVICGSLYLLGEVLALLAWDYPELASFRDLAEDRALMA